VPNLLGVMAEAPIALTAYIDLTDSLGKASLNAVEQQVMMLAARYANACGYCIAAHSTAAKNDRDAGTCPDGAPLPGNLPNPKFEAVRSS
jgi:AhpD family alkylhydroperoxidase